MPAQRLTSGAAQTSTQGKVVRCKRALYAAAPTFRGGSESQTHPKGLPSTWDHPTVHGQRQLPVGSLGLGAFRWRLVLVIAATNPVAGLGSHQSRRGSGLGRCIRHQLALRERRHRGDWLSAAKHTCPEASTRHRPPDGTSYWTRSGARPTSQRLLRSTIKHDAVTSSRRRNLSAIQDIVRSDNLTTLTINAAPYNGWRFYRSA